MGSQTVADEAGDLRAKLGDEMGSIDWPFLAVHARSGHLILVHQEINLLDAAVAIANNDTATVGPWVDSDRLTKPSEEEQNAYGETPGRYFQFVVVAPFVLAQEIQLNH